MPLKGRGKNISQNPINKNLAFIRLINIINIDLLELAKVNILAIKRL